MTLLILLLLLIPGVTFAQSGSSVEIGDTTFFNFDSRSGSRRPIGKTDFYNFSTAGTARAVGWGRAPLRIATKPFREGH
jgi:hypothetical protein